MTAILNFFNSIIVLKIYENILVRKYTLNNSEEKNLNIYNLLFNDSKNININIDISGGLSERQN